MSDAGRGYDAWYALYQAEDNDWVVLDVQRAPSDLEPLWSYTAKARARELLDTFPALTAPAPPPLLGVAWRYEVGYFGGDPIGPWQAVAHVANQWAFEEVSKAPPPPVGRPGGTAPPPGERPVPSQGAGASEDSGRGWWLAAGALVLGTLVVIRWRKAGR